MCMEMKEKRGQKRKKRGERMSEWGTVSDRMVLL